MNHDQEVAAQYPHGRGYGHDYMRGGEVLGGYGYSDREEYAKRRGEQTDSGDDTRSTTDTERERGARS
jgi:hypothetical protein